MGIFKLGTPTNRNLNQDTQAGKGAVKIPAGTTAQRPSKFRTGQTRYNTSTSNIEIYNGTSWVTASLG